MGGGERTQAEGGAGAGTRAGRGGLERELESLRRLRDEIRLQVHLGGAEARERFEGLEKDFRQLEGRLRRIGEQGREDAREVGRAARELAHELREGYRHLRASLGGRSPDS